MPSNQQNKKSNNLSVNQKQLVQYYTGPLPDPNTLKAYEEHLPGTAERIIRMAEKDQEIKNKVIEQEQNRNDLIAKNAHEENMAQIRAGSVFVYSLIFISLLFVACGFYMYLIDKNIYGLLVASPSMLMYLAYAIKYIFPSRR